MARKWSAFDRWARFRALTGAWERLKTRDPSPGVDAVTLADFATRVSLELEILYGELRAGTYQPLPLLCFETRDGEKTREISIPALRDRVVQEALLPVLDDALRPQLSPQCHGYVKGRSVTTAQHAAAAMVATGHAWVHRTDLRDGFGSVDRALLCQRLQQLLDERSARVIDRFVSAPRSRQGTVRPARARGIPLGQPVSPTCFNVYLAPLDRALEEADVRFIRYADDLLFLGREEYELDRALAVLDENLKEVRLERNRSKEERSRIKGDPFVFLGRFLAPGRVLEAVPEPAARAPKKENAGEELPERPPCLRTLYLQQHGVFVRARAGNAIVQSGAERIQRVPLRDLDRVVVIAGVSFSAPFLAACLNRGIPVHFALAHHGKTVFGTLARSDAESPLRTRSQLESHADDAFRLALCKALVRGKVENARWLLRRLRAAAAIARRLGRALGELDGKLRLEEVLGVEGEAAAEYFRALSMRVRPELGFTGRTRRPPRDGFNSLLSFGYTLIFNEMHSLLVQRRANPYIGYLHALRDNHPALASDLIEEFRAPMVDRFCVRAANLGQFRPDDFDPPRANGAVYMKGHARRRFIELWEAHMLAPLCRDEDDRVLDARRTMQRQVERLLDVVLGRSGEYVPFSAAEEFCSEADEEEPGPAEDEGSDSQEVAV